MQYPRATLAVFALLLVFLSVMALKHLMMDFKRYEVIPCARPNEFILLDRVDHALYRVEWEAGWKTYKSWKVELPLVPQGAIGGP